MGALILVGGLLYIAVLGYFAADRLSGFLEENGLPDRRQRLLGRSVRSEAGEILQTGGADTQDGCGRSDSAL